MPSSGKTQLQKIILSTPATYIHPCRLCLHVVIVVGLVCFGDPWGYAVEALIPDRSKVRFHTKCADGRGSLPGRVCSSDVLVQANQRWRNYSRGPHFFKKATLESATREGGPISGQLSAGAAGTLRFNGSRGPIPWTGYGIRYRGPGTRNN